MPKTLQTLKLKKNFASWYINQNLTVLSTPSFSPLDAFVEKDNVS